MLPRKQAIKIHFIFPPHLTSASALLGETGNPEIASFHLNAACLVVATHPLFFCIIQLFHIENNCDILSSCRTFFGTHLVVEIVLVSHTTRSYTRNRQDSRGWVVSTQPLFVDYTVYVLEFKRT